MQKFIPLMCLIQILGHYWKTDHIDFLLESNPLRRQDPWRLFTTCLVHDGDIHLWSNVVGQLMFGLPLETVLRWRSTAGIYFTSTLFASLLNSSLQACFTPSVGASDAVNGLAVACVLGYFLSNPRCIGGYTLFWALLTLMSELCVSVETLIILLPPELAIHFIGFLNIDDVAHIGGALGGFIAGVNIWHLSLSHGQRRGWILPLKRVTRLLATCFLFVTVSANLYYLCVLRNELSYIISWNSNFGSAFPEFGTHPLLAKRICSVLWTNRDLVRIGKKL